MVPWDNITILQAALRWRGSLGCQRLPVHGRGHLKRAAVKLTAAHNEHPNGVESDPGRFGKVCRRRPLSGFYAIL